MVRVWRYIMTPVLGIIASSNQQGRSVAVGSYDALATVVVPIGGLSSITFAGIPTNYQHLQIRAIGQSSRGTFGNDQMTMRINGDTGSNYSSHILTGDGTGASSSGVSSQTSINLSFKLGTTVSNTFGAFIIDVLDYAKTSKNKTIRTLAGVDINGTIAGYGGEVQLASGGYYSTNAITSFTFTPSNGNFTRYSQFALYGVK
jgi:hypothetical protein